MSTPMRPVATPGWPAGRARACGVVNASFIACSIRGKSHVAGHITRMLRGCERERPGRATTQNKIDQNKMAKTTVTRRSLLASLGATLAALAAWRPAWAQTRHVAEVTFILFNDFYLMAEQPFPDGKSRGGFARLAAVVKAERERARAEGRTVIVAHGGDTLSPSVMSGLDQGAHIVALTNMIAPDIFVPGNHEFDFGKAMFLQRMGEARFPLYGANLRDAAGAAIPGFRDRALLELG